MLPLFIELVDVQQTLLGFGGLFIRHSPIHGSLNFWGRVFTTPVNEWSHVKRLSRIAQNMLDGVT